MKTGSVSVIDFFSGCGGTSAGFKSSGMRILGGLDHDPDSARTFRANFPRAGFIERDIRSVSLDEVRSLYRGNGPVLFAGCAPCQPFSKHNRSTSLADPRRDLLKEFERFVVGLMPDFVVIENVPGLQSGSSKWTALTQMVRRLRKAGYYLESSVLRALDFGVPQERRRLVVVASLHGHARLPEPTHGVTPGLDFVTVRQAIGHMAELEHGDVDAYDSDHAAMRLSPLNLARIRSTPEGGDRRDWVSSLVPACHSDHKGHSDSYGRMWWDRPASGLTTRCLSYSNGRFGHPEQDRAISLREAALLQTFPQRFRFVGSLTSRGMQVGNAVPPLMARRIGEALVATT